jgi:hypothetical protein
MDTDLGALWRRMKAGLRGWWLYILPLPLALDVLVSLWTGEIAAMLAAGAGYAAFVIGATVARRGFASEVAFQARPYAARPPPYKAIAGGILGLATAFAAFASAGHDPVTAAAFGVACAIGFFLAYGFDPRPAAAVLPADLGITSEEIRAALNEAYAKVDGIEAARQEIRSPELRARLSRIITGAQNVLATIEENPRVLRRARRFINVYLDGARQVSERYARSHGGSDSPQLEHNFRQLLIDMEAVCEEQQRKLADNSLVDLDVQIEVLATRLRREGVA